MSYTSTLRNVTTCELCVALLYFEHFGTLRFVTQKLFIWRRLLGTILIFQHSDFVKHFTNPVLYTYIYYCHAAK